MRALLARVLDRVAPVQPAETSFLDVVNGVNADRCAVAYPVGCPEPPAGEIVGVRLCTGHLVALS